MDFSTHFLQIARLYKQQQAIYRRNYNTYIGPLSYIYLFIVGTFIPIYLILYCNYKPNGLDAVLYRDISSLMAQRMRAM